MCVLAVIGVIVVWGNYWQAAIAALVYAAFAAPMMFVARRHLHRHRDLDDDIRKAWEGRIYTMAPLSILWYWWFGPGKQ